MTKPDRAMRACEAVATYLGEDIADTREREYQPGHTAGVAVYSTEHFYLIALRPGLQPSRALRAQFPACAFTKAEGPTAAYLLTRGKQIWRIQS